MRTHNIVGFFFSQTWLKKWKCAIKTDLLLKITDFAVCFLVCAMREAAWLQCRFPASHFTRRQFTLPSANCCGCQCKVNDTPKSDCSANCEIEQESDRMGVYKSSVDQKKKGPAPFQPECDANSAYTNCMAEFASHRHRMWSAQVLTWA